MRMSDLPSLLDEIEDFLAEFGMSPSYFGKLAVNNSELVARLRAGRRILTTTEFAVRQFMYERRQQVAGSDGAAA